MTIDWQAEIQKALKGDNPSVVLILAARQYREDVLTETLWGASEVVDRMPAWIDALASGNPELWTDVIAEVRRMMEVEG